MKALEALYGIQKRKDQNQKEAFPRDTAKSMVVERLTERRPAPPAHADLWPLAVLGL